METEALALESCPSQSPELKPEVDTLGECGDAHQVSEEVQDTSEDEVEEARDELEVLQADTIFHDFVQDVSLNREIGDDPKDSDYSVEKDLEQMGKSVEDLDADESDTDSTATNEEPEVLEGEANDVDANGVEANGVEANDDVDDDEPVIRGVDNILIPPQALRENAARFPAFWRVRQQLQQLPEDLDYRSDEDPDYRPAKIPCTFSNPDEGDEMSSCSGSSSSDDENFIDDCPNEGDDDEDGDVSNLVEMIEDLAIPDSDQPVEEAAEDEVGEQASLVRSIVEFDADGYKSDEDPDFVPPVDVDHVEEEASSSSESDGDESSATEVMEEE